MDRNLLVSAQSGHPIRRGLIKPDEASRMPHADDQDWKLFLVSFVAFFVCFYTFIA